MSDPKIVKFDRKTLEDQEGCVALTITSDGKTPALPDLDETLGGTIARLAAEDKFKDAKPGHIVSLPFPTGLAASALVLVRLDDDADGIEARKAGAALAKRMRSEDITILSDNVELIFGYTLRDYEFTARKSKPAEPKACEVMANDPKALKSSLAPMLALTGGVHFTRDLTNEPANYLTTITFAERLEALTKIGLEVEVLEAKELKKLGMGAFLSVGLGSATPTKLVIMRWNGGKKEKPFALVGKGVIFDTGGISMKPAAGMEAMTMDMGGAGVVAGVMKSLALRKAKANVVGLVGLVENMPDANAQRPGDVVTSMKGDTIEVNNTDAEGRLVLSDVLWYTQDRFEPTGIIDLATLTGAAIVALGHENAAVFSNDDTLADNFLAAAKSEEEGAWRLPMGKGYDKMLKSRVADMKNSAGRPAGSITAAQFLKRFVKDETPWIHLDIAGVAAGAGETTYAPNGATGWGVRAINRFLADNYET